MSDLTQARLKELLHYDADTGVFTWIKSGIGRSSSLIAGGLQKTGSRHIKINNKSYQAHRLAWLYIEGEFSSKMIDHINGIRDDNRWINLRTATRQENCYNRGKQLNNKSGYKGVSWNNSRSKWVAQIVINGKKKHLGLFIAKEQAYYSYCEAAKKFHGEFANIM
jgi:hypothetical protein